MPAIDLSPAERKAHRSAAHHLSPVVTIGSDGLTPAVEREVDRALNAHGLIKVRVLSDDRAARERMLTALADSLAAGPVQHIGKLLVLWRPIPAEEKPARDDRRAGPRRVKLVSHSKNAKRRPTVRRVRVLGNQRVTAGGLIKRSKQRPVSVKKKSQSK